MGQSFDDIFGPNAKGGGGGGKRYIKWDNVGDVLALVVRGPIVNDKPQIDFETKKPKWMTHTEGDVKPDGKDRWVARVEGDFDPDDFEKVFQALEVMIPVTVAAKVEGKAEVEGFEPFDAEWTFKGDQKKKFKDALLDFGEAIDVGTIIQVKLLVKGGNGKPGQYAIKIKAGE